MGNITFSSYIVNNQTETMIISMIIMPLMTYFCYLLGIIIYNLYFHPLARFPGPLLWAATPLPYVWYQISGRLPFIYKQLHDQYGDVVRVLPYKLSFNDPAAWKDIYQRTAGHEVLKKDTKKLGPGGEGVYNIINVFDFADHARYRRNLAPAFSTRALLEQEQYIIHYVELLVSKLRKRSPDQPQDMVKWANLIYFDIIADLTFGKSLDGLEREEYHPWLSGLFGTTMKKITIYRAMNQFPHVAKVLRLFTPKGLIEQQKKHFTFIKASVESRMNSELERSDFMSYILPYSEEKVKMSMAEVRETYGALMLAGSENVATTLVFTIYHLLQNPDVLDQLIQEIRTGFKNPEEINFLALKSLKYLSAVVDESMRIHPAAPTSQPRVVPDGGCLISGHQVPGGMCVAVPPYCMNHSPQYFQDPESFIPDRWLNNPKFGSDIKGSFQPFQLGPRACIGQQLALAEVQIALARILWEFDIEFADEMARKWDEDLKIFHLWQLKPLYVRLVPVLVLG